MQTQAAAGVGATIMEPARFGWIRLMGLGALLVVLAPVIPMLAEGFEPFFAVMMAPVAIGLVLLRFARKTGVVWLGVVSLALLIMNAGFIPEALLHPESPADFVPVSMLTVGALVAVISTPAALREARGRSGQSAFPRIAARVAFALVCVAAVGSVVARGNVTNDAPSAGSIPVAIEKFAFGSESLAVQSGEVALYLTNNDAARHTFTIDELGVDVSIAPGQSRLVRFDASDGQYRFYCKPHDPGMEGRLVVE